MAGRGWRKFPFALARALVWSSAAVERSGSGARRSSREQHLRHLRPPLPPLRYAAPSPASIERDCARTLDDKSSPAGQEGAGKSTPAKKSVLSLKSMEHTPTPDIATLSVGELKALISGAGLSYADCVEKSDLRARAAEARARLAPKKERSSSHQSPLVIRTSRRHTARCR